MPLEYKTNEDFHVIKPEIPANVRNTVADIGKQELSPALFVGHNNQH